MDVLKLKNGFSVWVPLFEDDDKVKIKIRHLNQADYDNLTKQATEGDGDKKGGNVSRTMNPEKYIELLADAAVIDWTGITEGDQPYPCTQENRHYLAHSCTDFQALIRSTPLIYSRMIALEKEQEKKLNRCRKMAH